jgi:hypothetical protein
LQNYVSISRSFPPGRRQPELGINHYIALQGLPEGQQDEMADMAVANGLSVEALRHEVRKTRPGYITDDSNQPGRTMSPPSAVATRNGYHTTDDIDDRSEYLATSPAAYDDVPFSHHGDGEHPDADLWPDERIDSMVESVAIDATDDDGITWRAVLADDVAKLLRTMRDEYETLWRDNHGRN